MNILQAQPNFRMKMPKNEWRQPFFFISESYYVQSFIMFCIVVNTCILTLKWFGQSEDFNTTLETLNFVFAIIFTSETIIKLIGYGHRYFNDAWNIFDMIIVITTIVGIIMG